MLSSFIPGFVDSRSEKPAVETRIVAFLDILGFKAFIRDHLSQPDQINRLDYLLHITEKMLSGRIRVAPHTEIRMFSDCICVSCSLSTPNLIRFICTLEALQFYLINAGLFIRGGMSIGRHCSTDRMIVSEALVSAYELESTIAVYPRVVVDKSVIGAVNSIRADEWFDPWESAQRSTHSSELHIQYDSTDSVPFLNYFAYMYSIDSAPLASELLFCHRHSIQRAVDESTDQSGRIKEKFQWLARYFNRNEEEHHAHYSTPERYHVRLTN